MNIQKYCVEPAGLQNLRFEFGRPLKNNRRLPKVLKLILGPFSALFDFINGAYVQPSKPKWTIVFLTKFYSTTKLCLVICIWRPAEYLYSPKTKSKTSVAEPSTGVPQINELKTTTNCRNM